MNVKLIENKFDNSIVDELLSLNWETKRAARHEYFMSINPMSYSYGNKFNGDEKYYSRPFEPKTLSMLDSLNQELNTNLNACFLNKYDNEKQHLGWHSDDFEGMDQTQPIVVVSFGAEREIWFKEKGEKGIVPKENRFLLTQGSSLIMGAGLQDTHYHKIPKHDRPCDWRISLTFRSFYES